MALYTYISIHFVCHYVTNSGYGHGKLGEVKAKRSEQSMRSAAVKRIEFQAYFRHSFFRHAVINNRKLCKYLLYAHKDIKVAMELSKYTLQKRVEDELRLKTAKNYLIIIQQIRYLQEIY